MTDEHVLAKLALLRENLERLTELPQASFAEFAADFRNLDSALHRLQTSIQILIDIASLATAKLGLGAPETSVDALDRLERAGRLPPGSAQRFTPVFGFSNRIVHLYDRIDPVIVFRVLTEERNDIEELAWLLLAALPVA